MQTMDAGAPTVGAGALDLVQKFTLAMANTNATEGWEKEKAGDHRGSLLAWQKIFGPKFV